VWPFPLIDYWRMVREPDLSEYTFHPRSGEQNNRA
jgi:hypothetical protein